MGAVAEVEGELKRASAALERSARAADRAGLASKPASASKPSSASGASSSSRHKGGQRSAGRPSNLAFSSAWAEFMSVASLLEEYGALRPLEGGEAEKDEEADGEADGQAEDEKAGTRRLGLTDFGDLVTQLNTDNELWLALVLKSEALDLLDPVTKCLRNHTHFTHLPGGGTMRAFRKPKVDPPRSPLYFPRGYAGPSCMRALSNRCFF